ncbi:MAG: DUF3943 domain-containing protein [Treponema sp.]|nr:DUF3943 domain-containing protein [Treponema sp.]
MNIQRLLFCGILLAGLTVCVRAQEEEENAAAESTVEMETAAENPVEIAVENTVETAAEIPAIEGALNLGGPAAAYYDYGDGQKHFFWALGGNLFSNVFLAGVNRYIGRVSWAQSSVASIKDNFSQTKNGEWDWDNDVYFTNQAGHVYEGAAYYTAARANGFGFWGSLGFALFGSASWELIVETITPSLNDIIVTPVGGAQLGEMMHRLHREIANPVGAFVASPMDSLNRLSGRKPYRGERNIYQVSSNAGAAWVSQQHIMGGDTYSKDNKITLDLGGKVIYGDPFIQQSSAPYDHFELQVRVGGAMPLFYYFHLFSDGYMFSYSVSNTAKKQESTGLTLHYDVVSTKFFDFGSQALAWTLKYRRELAGDLSMELKAHLGSTFFGAQNYYYYDATLEEVVSGRDYSMGPMAKAAFSLIHPRYGQFSFDLMVHQLFISFANKRIPRPEGIDYFWFADVSYLYPLNKNFSLGISDSFAHKIGGYTGVAENYKWNNTVKVFVQYSAKGSAFPRERYRP